MRAGARRGYVPEALPGRVALPVARGRRRPRRSALPEAWLIAARDAGPLNELDRLTLHQAVTIVALELLRRRVVDDTERRLAGDVLSALVSGDLTGRGARTPAGAVRAARAGGRARARPVARRARRGRGGAGASGARGGRRRARGAGADSFLCALLPAVATTSCSRSRNACSRAWSGRRRAAAGRRGPVPSRRASCGAGSTRRAARWRPATLAANGSVRRPGWRPTATSAPSSCCSRCRTTTRCGCSATRSSAPIEDSEGAYGGELMRSLEAFIECNGQWERAAKALFCHRHTLRYRIRRVEELTGRSLDSARDRIDFWLALRGRELVQPER